MSRVLVFTLMLVVAEAARAAEPVDYARSVKPVLANRCYACHGALKQSGGLRLDTAGLAIKGGKAGPTIEPGKPEESLLLDRVTATDDHERMPPEGEPLKPGEVEAIRNWIQQGARSPADEAPERDPRDHWAFRAPVRPPVPKVKDAAWSANPVDAFLQASREAKGLVAQPPADRKVWLRRVTFDLTGLPPTPEEMQAFLNDTSADADRKLVDALLARPQYGERWGRHLLDIYRYSDWWGLGAEVRNSQKHIWHWRDWVIESLNADKGYDRMIREMIAGDEIAPDDPKTLRATGFLARQYFKFNRTSWLDETIQHTSKAFLGLTWNCAKCHDHKYDPISQKDYYRFRAIFEPYQVRTDVVPGEPDLEKDGIPRAFDCNLDIKTYLHKRGDDRNPDTSAVMEPGLPAFLSPAGYKPNPVALPIEAAEPGLRPFVHATLRKDLDARLSAARKAVAKAKAALDAERKPERPASIQDLRVREASLSTLLRESEALGARAEADRGRFATPPAKDAPELTVAAAHAERLWSLAKAEESLAKAELQRIQAAKDEKASKAAIKAVADAKEGLKKARADVDQPAKTYASLQGSLKTLESNLETEDSRRKPFPRTSTGRRAALADWMADRKNPLTARVIVNHVWARHFGKPLVPTVFDFGRKGAAPTHPELLDWLAVEFMDHGWSLKHLHRLILTSKSYRMASTAAGASKSNLAVDPENKLYWRANPTRLEAQVVRDALLHLAGRLDLTPGGPTVPPNDDKSRRRSLYFFHSHNEHNEFLSMFDDASVLECYRRDESIVPQQALALENSPISFEMAGRITEKLAAHKPTDEFVSKAFRMILCTDPTAEERAISVEAIGRLVDASRKQKRDKPEAHARSLFVQALLNHNDFVTVR